MAGGESQEARRAVTRLLPHMSSPLHPSLATFSNASRSAPFLQPIIKESWLVFEYVLVAKIQALFAYILLPALHEEFLHTLSDHYLPAAEESLAFQPRSAGILRCSVRSFWAFDRKHSS